jgi:hypothetical protein
VWEEGKDVGRYLSKDEQRVPKRKTSAAASGVVVGNTHKARRKPT